MIFKSDAAIITFQNQGIFKKNFFNVYVFFERKRERERDREEVGKGQRKRETQNLKQAPGSEPSAQSLTQGLNSRTARS